MSYKRPAWSFQGLDRALSSQPPRCKASRADPRQRRQRHPRGWPPRTNIGAIADFAVSGYTEREADKVADGTVMRDNAIDVALEIAMSMAQLIFGTRENGRDEGLCYTGLTADEITVGTRTERRYEIMVAVWKRSESCPVINPLYFDDAVASSYMFGRRIAYGMFSASNLRYIRHGASRK